MRLVVVAALAALATLPLSGCAHQLVLTPEDGLGPMGHGAAPMKWVSNSGQLTVDLNGKRYAGEYVVQNTGSVVGFGTGFSSSGAVATGTMYGASTDGGGKAYLQEAGGASLSCNFTFSSWSNTGVGFCRCSDGKGYNLMIR